MAVWPRDENCAQHDRARHQGPEGARFFDRRSAPERRQSSHNHGQDPTLLDDLKQALEPATMGDGIAEEPIP